MKISHVGRHRTPGFAHTWLRAARKERGWTQGRLAAMLDVSITTVGSWERGLNAPEPPQLLALARVFGVAPAELLDSDPDGWTLVELRVVSGLRQQQVAEQLNTTPNRIGSLEAGYERPDERLRAGLADAYGVAIDTIDAAWQRGRDQLISD